MKFGPFLLKKKIGEGGFATVWLAYATQTSRTCRGQPVALKILKDKYLGDKRIKRDFIKEGTLQKQLCHENITRCYGIVKDKDRLGLCLELVRGTNFKAFAHGPEAFEKDLPVLLQVSLALGHLHSRGIVHLDLKPGNILVDTRGCAKLIDFCLAFKVSFFNKIRRWLERSAIPGSPSYMAPEVIRGEVPDPRADMYSLGVITYWTLTGKLPFTGSARRILRDHTVSTPVAPSRLNPRVPPCLERLVFSLLSKDREKRLADPEQYCRTILESGLIKSAPTSEAVARSPN